MGNADPGFGPRLHTCFKEEDVLTLSSSIFLGKSEWCGACFDSLFANVAVIIQLPSHGDSIALPIKNRSLFSLPVTFSWPCGFCWPIEDKGSDWALVSGDCAHPPAPPEPIETPGDRAQPPCTGPRGPAGFRVLEETRLRAAGVGLAGNNSRLLF